jgi:TonB-dependent Receptor Plug Domain
VELTVKARVRVDLRLEVGEVTQTVEVAGAAAMLKTDSPEVSTLITQEQLQSLPAENRHFLALSVLTPGAYRTYGHNRIADFSGGESVGFGGLNTGQNNFILDGVSNNVELTGGFNAVPAMDAIQELSIQTDSYSAEFGRSAGAIVNVAMKSGANQFHGFGYDYIQNDIFNARPYDFTGTHPGITPLRKNLFGGGIGGPIKKNKFFFFANYEGLRMPATVIELDTTPTALEKKGDFSQSGWTVYDPATTNAAGKPHAVPRQRDSGQPDQQIHAAVDLHGLVFVSANHVHIQIRYLSFLSQQQLQGWESHGSEQLPVVRRQQRF